jgi:hypothetical protein
MGGTAGAKVLLLFSSTVGVDAAEKYFGLRLRQISLTACQKAVRRSSRAQASASRGASMRDSPHDVGTRSLTPGTDQRLDRGREIIAMPLRRRCELYINLAYRPILHTVWHPILQQQ